MRTRGIALVGLGVAAALSGCSGIETEPETDTETSASPSADAGVEPVECEEPAQSALDGLTDGSDLTPVAGAALAVPDAESYVIAIEVEVAGVDGSEIGVWEAINLDAGPYRSVDGIAQEFTDWPASELTSATDVVGDVKSCLE